MKETTLITADIGSFGAITNWPFHALYISQPNSFQAIICDGEVLGSLCIFRDEEYKWYSFIVKAENVTVSTACDSPHDLGFLTRERLKGAAGNQLKDVKERAYRIAQHCRAQHSLTQPLLKDALDAAEKTVTYLGQTFAKSGDIVISRTDKGDYFEIDLDRFTPANDMRKMYERVWERGR